MPDAHTSCHFSCQLLVRCRMPTPTACVSECGWVGGCECVCVCVYEIRICFHAVLLKVDFASCEPSCAFRYLCTHHIFTVNDFCCIVNLLASLPKIIVSQVKNF
jgi:hypothetical protein